MLNVLVTGGAGYVGSALVPRLRMSHNVDVVDTCIFGQDTKDVIVKDFRDLTEKDLEQYDVVIHLAALSNDPMAHFSPDLNFEVNAAGATLLAYRAKRAGVRRFVFASSASVYQGITDKELATPNNPNLKPQEPYAISKLQTELGLRSLSSQTFIVTILRKGTIGGYAPRMRYDLVLNTMFRNAMADGKVTVFVNHAGDAVLRPHLDIDAAVDWYVSAADGLLGNATYNAVTRNLSVLIMAEKVCEVTGAELTRKEVFDATLLRNYVMKPDIAPMIRNEQIANTIKKMMEHSPTDWDNPKYYNIRMWEQWLKEKSQF